MYTSSTRTRVDHRAVLRAGGRSTRLRVLMLRYLLTLAQRAAICLAQAEGLGSWNPWVLQGQRPDGLSNPSANAVLRFPLSARRLATLPKGE